MRSYPLLSPKPFSLSLASFLSPHPLNASLFFIKSRRKEPQLERKECYCVFYKMQELRDSKKELNRERGRRDWREDGSGEGAGREYGRCFIVKIFTKEF